MKFRELWARMHDAIRGKPRPAPEVPRVAAAVMDNFTRSFGGSGGGCVRDCRCGRVFYNSDGGWDWEDGELERLRANPNATDLDYSVGTIEFEGQDYVWDCECWKPRAARIIVFLQGHADEIARFLTLEKRRKEGIAKAAPEVES